MLCCFLGGGQLYMWGKLKSSGDDWMYPKPLMDLRLSFVTMEMLLQRICELQALFDTE